jgi:methionine-rich copper-binding protein CopC
VVVVLVAAGAFALGTPGAQAHAELTQTSPAENAVLSSPPTTVRLTFNQDLLSSFAMLTVAVNKGAPRAVRATVDGRTMTAPVPAGRPGAGRWTVTYRIVSVDGHVMSGTLRFTVDPASAATSRPGPTPAPDATPTETAPPTPTTWSGAGLVGAPAAEPTASPPAPSGSSGPGWWAAGAVCLLSAAVLSLRGRRRT